MSEIIEGMPEADYRARPELNASRLALMDDCPRTFFVNESLQTDAMAVGVALHQALLEPARFKECYVVEPSMVHAFIRDDKGKKTSEKAWQPVNRRMPEHRELLDAWGKEQEAKGSIVLKPEDMENLTGMINSIAYEMANPPPDVNNIPYPTLKELLSSTRREVSGFKKYRGFDLKARADILCDTVLGVTVVDIKKTQRAKASAFQRQVWDLLYDMKAAFYKEVFNADAFIWVAVEEQAPHGVGIYDAELYLESGKHKMDRFLDQLAVCQRDNYWPSYTRGIEKLQPSDWQMKLMEGIAR